ncbi:MAG: hypothetical protein ACREC9_13250 [Methylocella sp.]
MVTLPTSLHIVSVAAAIVIFAGGGSAVAGTWAQDHPRRAEVNRRLANQNHRINRELHEGEITRAQASNLHRQDRTVRQEERFMASQRGSHITRAEQRSLNQQENSISREVGR